MNGSHAKEQPNNKAMSSLVKSNGLSAEQLIMESSSADPGQSSPPIPFRVPEGLRAILNDLSKEVTTSLVPSFVKPVLL